MNDFSITAETPVIIYGASYIGSVTGKELIKNGGNLIGFIDQRAFEIGECLGLPVYSLEELKTQNRKDAIIFVAVKNVYYHQEIARQLNDSGYYNIIYKTKKAISGNMDEKERRLDLAYEKLYKKGELEEGQLPVLLAERDDEFQEVAVVSEEKDNLVVRMPVELLFTGHTDAQWEDVPVLAAVPYWRVFRYFEGIEGYTPEDYVQLCQKGAEQEHLNITEGWKKYVVENRRSVYRQMRWKLEFEPEYFYENAPQANYNDRGYFNLLTGKHRVCFMVALGYGTVPVKVKKEEWVRFYDSDKVKEIRQQLKENGIDATPIAHPFFMGNPAYDTRENRILLMKLFEELYDKGILCGNDRKEISICLQLEKDWYFGEFFSKMGMNITGEGSSKTPAAYEYQIIIHEDKIEVK